jgi:hypothetical protein
MEKDFHVIDGETHSSEDCVWSNYQSEFILKEDAEIVFVNGEDDHVTNDIMCNEFAYCEDTEDNRPMDETVWCDVEEVTYSDEMQMTESYCGVHGAEENFCNSDNYRWIEYGRAADQWVCTDQITYCEDIGDYVEYDDAHYCENEDEYYYDEDLANGNKEGCIGSYHSNKHPEDLNYGYQKSRFSVGFEIEKTKFEMRDGTISDEKGDEFGEYYLFAGAETDSSCGVEAVTNILPLSPVGSKYRKQVFDMIDEASHIIDSPSDINCGGHITISMKQDSTSLILDGYDIVNQLKPRLSLIYALYRHRLKRSYCRSNKGIKKQDNTKYSPVNVKGNRVELRIPSRVTCTKQLKLRYDLMYNIMHYTFQDPKPLDDFLVMVRPIVDKMYGGDTNRVDSIYEYAKSFRRYLILDEVSDNIHEFINND